MNIFLEERMYSFYKILKNVSDSEKWRPTDNEWPPTGLGSGIFTLPSPCLLPLSGNTCGCHDFTLFSFSSFLFDVFPSRQCFTVIRLGLPLHVFSVLRLKALPVPALPSMPVPLVFGPPVQLSSVLWFPFPSLQLQIWALSSLHFHRPKCLPSLSFTQWTQY